ncbi:MAG: protein-L-isoaspartate(D-aspartate) O-methyltransferase [Planctomycetia bacterium]|nr:protein-L-isoaspartate(D-aspartate) O-methyltransferase [Planctomycetia bacterium]
MLHAQTSTSDFKIQRDRMVRDEVAGAGVKNERVLDAIRSTQRHEFVNFRDRAMAYYDMALPIGEGQTISPPFIVAYMTEQLDPQPTDKVLEIGTGSGYQAAVLSPLVKEVYTIEIVEPLGRQAARVLQKLQYKNVFTKIGDGFQGWPEKAPFDKIIITCSPEKVPQPIVDQLREGGRIIVPLGQRYQQMFYLFVKKDGKLVSEALRPTLFVPMTGKAEAQREVKPDALHPTLVNGSFETSYLENEKEVPQNWHYVRQATLVADEKEAPQGKQFIVFKNAEPGRGSQALQGFAVDGKQVHTIELSFQVRGTDLRPGTRRDEMPLATVTFYDERQDTVGERAVGPWRGSFKWQQETTELDVPLRAKTAIVRIGLLGALGEIAFDGVQVRAVEGKKKK